MGDHKRITSTLQREQQRARWEAMKELVLEPRWFKLMGWGRKYRKESWWVEEQLAHRLRAEQRGESSGND